MVNENQVLDEWLVFNKPANALDDFARMADEPMDHLQETL